MGYRITSSDYYPVTGKSHIEAVLDADSDLAYLPTDCAPGSIAIVADKDGKVYMLNASGVWKEL